MAVSRARGFYAAHLVTHADAHIIDKMGKMAARLRNTKCYNTHSTKKTNKNGTSTLRKRTIIRSIVL